MTKRVPRKTNSRRTSKTSRKIPLKRNQKQSFSESLKERISSLVVWLLVAVNFVLIASLIHKILTQTNTPPDVKIIQQSDPDIEVLNGTNVNGLAKAYADYLRQQGFDVVKVDNAESHNYKETKVIDLKSARPIKNSAAIKVASELGIDEDKVLAMLDTDSQSDVRIILGADYVKLKSYQKIR